MYLKYLFLCDLKVHILKKSYLPFFKYMISERLQSVTVQILLVEIKYVLFFYLENALYNKY